MLSRDHFRRNFPPVVQFFLVTATVLLLFGNACGSFKPTAPMEASVESFSSKGDSQPALRRLSREEANATLNLILGDTSNSARVHLPKDVTDPFDSDVATQDPSLSLIEGAETLAIEVGNALVADTARRDRIVGCPQSAASDRACLERFISRIGRLFFRRTLTPAEVDGFTNLASADAIALGSFDEGVRTALRIFIQHPAFLYRFEVGTPSDGVVWALNGYERATRLAFFLWGSGPDDELLSAAERGELMTTEGVRNQAERLLRDRRALGRIQKFHSDWFAYTTLPHDSQTNLAMKAEADAMIERVLVTDQKPWTELLQTQQTWIDGTMGAIYRISGLSSPQLVNWPADRKGLLSTGAFLSAVPKFGDTSPTQRGKFVRERLMCQIIPPPPSDVDVDSPPQDPGGSPCKQRKYELHRNISTSCFGCHQKMDPIGFGLERYDRFGAYRTQDAGPDGAPLAECTIEGQGSIPNLGTFSGPGALSDLLLSSGDIESCMIKQLLHFTYGVKPTYQMNSYLTYLTSRYRSAGGQFQDLLLEVVLSDPFLNRKP